MPTGLRRFQKAETLHFITFSSYHRLPYLSTPTAKILTPDPRTNPSPPHARIYAYVLMPEHVHLPINEPPTTVSVCSSPLAESTLV